MSEQGKEKEPFLGHRGQDASGKPTTKLDGVEYWLDLWSTTYADRMRDQLISQFGDQFVEELMTMDVDLLKNDDKVLASILIGLAKGLVNGLKLKGLSELRREILSKDVFRYKTGPDGRRVQVPVYDKEKNYDHDFETFYRGKLHHLDRLMIWVLKENLGDFMQGLL